VLNVQQRADRGTRLVGWGFPLCYHTADGNDQLAALRTRLTFPGTRPVADIWEDVRHWMIELDWLYPLPDFFHKVSTDEWLTRYSGAQLRDLLAARDKLRSHGLRPSEMCIARMFVKREARVWLWPFLVPEQPKPRVILAGNPKEKVALGPSMIAVAKALHENWTSDDAVFFECGSTQDDVAQWFNDNLACYGESWLFQSDASKMDRSQSSGSMGAAIDICEQLGVSGLALECLRNQVKDQKVFCRNGIVVKCPAFLKTGVPNTTIFNSIVNALIHAWSFTRHGGKPFEDFILMIRGDDNLGFVRPGLDAYLVQDAKELGFNLKVTRPRRVEDVRFCSNAFYPTSTGLYVPAPTIGKCLAKLNATIADVSSKNWKSHMRGVALGLLALTSHVPLLSDYVQMVLRNTQGHTGKMMRNAVKVAQMKYFKGSRHESCADSDAFVARMYGVSLTHVQAVRSCITSMKEPGFYGGAQVTEFFCRGLEIEYG